MPSAMAEEPWGTSIGDLGQRGGGGTNVVWGTVQPICENVNEFPRTAWGTLGRSETCRTGLKQQCTGSASRQIPTDCKLCSGLLVVFQVYASIKMNNQCGSSTGWDEVKMMARAGIDGFGFGVGFRFG